MTQLFYQADGNIPIRRVRSKSLLRGLAMLVAVVLSIGAEIPSTPLALFGSKCMSDPAISSLSMRNSSGRLSPLRTLSLTRLDSSSGGTPVLKQFLKKAFSILAFSILEVAAVTPFERFGIAVVDLLRSLMAFQNCLVLEGSMFAKKDLFASLSKDTTLFLDFLYFKNKVGLLVELTFL